MSIASKIPTILGTDKLSLRSTTPKITVVIVAKTIIGLALLAPTVLRPLQKDMKVKAPKIPFILGIDDVKAERALESE